MLVIFICWKIIVYIIFNNELIVIVGREGFFNVKRIMIVKVGISIYLLIWNVFNSEDFNFFICLVLKFFFLYINFVIVNNIVVMR